MLTSVNIRNFRGLENLSLQPLGRVNLIAGKNGVGKTAVLESLWIFSAPDLPELASRVSFFRGLPPPRAENIFLDLFRGFTGNNDIEVVGLVGTSQQRRKLSIHLQEHASSTAGFLQPGMTRDSSMERSTQTRSEGEYEIVFDYQDEFKNTFTSRAWWVEHTLIPPQGPVPVGLANAGVQQERQLIPDRANSVFMSALHRSSLEEDASRYGALQIEGKDEEILDVLRTLEPRLKSLNTIIVHDTPLIYANLGEARPIPARLLGEGFNRVLSLALSICSFSGGFVLVDEIENGLHYTVIQDMFRNLHALAQKFDVQVVATTHSAECIEAAYNALSSEDEEVFAFHRIDRSSGHAVAAYLSHEMLGTAIQHDLEMR